MFYILTVICRFMYVHTPITKFEGVVDKHKNWKHTNGLRLISSL